MNVRAAIVLLSVALFGVSCGSTRSGSDLHPWGLSYRLKTFTTPRPNRAHILTVDLAAGKAEPAVVVAPDPDGDGPAEAALTNPFALATGMPVLAFINTNPWDGFPDATGKPDRHWRGGQKVNITGLAMSNRVVRSPAEITGSVCFTADRRVFIGGPTNGIDAIDGVGGWQPILKNGDVIVKPEKNLNLAPRTAIGTDQTGTRLWLVVVDGRQPGYSEGMSVSELGTLMKELGCWEAANMDGGGSSIMALAGADGALHYVNSPSDRFLGVTLVRPLPMILTIRKKPALVKY